MKGPFLATRMNVTLCVLIILNSNSSIDFNSIRFLASNNGDKQWSISYLGALGPDNCSENCCTSKQYEDPAVLI